MSQHEMNRREFIKGTATAGMAAAAGWAMASESVGETPAPIRLGAPLYSAPADPEELAQAHRAQGYRAAYCPDVPLTDTDRIDALAKAFARHDVVIAEVGRWCNLLDADTVSRRANLERVIDGLALAEAIGARCCVNIAGSFSTEEWFGPHPKNLSDDFFDAAVENARKIIDAVKPARAKFCYEMVGWSLPDSPDAYLRMMRAVDREGFAVHLDTCNLVNSPERFYRNTDLINECFDKLGPWIVSCHGKDLVWEVEMNIHFREVRPGMGAMDHATLLKRLAALPEPPPLMLEHLNTAEEYAAGRDFLVEMGTALGLRYE